MRVITQDVVLQEVPGHISLAFAVHGCPNNCPGCSWKREGYDEYFELSKETYEKLLDDNNGLITCIVWLGGEWSPDLPEFLELSKSKGYETCLYTGLDEVPEAISKRLTFLKTGSYMEALGGLTSPITNQRFINVKTGECLNYLFQRSTSEQKEDDTINR